MDVVDSLIFLNLKSSLWGKICSEIRISDKEAIIGWALRDGSPTQKFRMSSVLIRSLIRDMPLKYEIG